MNKSIVILSPFEDDNKLYPHLRHFVNLLKESNDVEYVYLSERGLDFEKKIRRIKNKKIDLTRYYFLFILEHQPLRLDHISVGKQRDHIVQDGLGILWV